jgi:hypothetical protein
MMKEQCHHRRVGQKEKFFTELLKVGLENNQNEIVRLLKSISSRLRLRSIVVTVLNNVTIVCLHTVEILFVIF